MFPIAQRAIAQVVLVGDDAIRHAQQALWGAVRVVAEPGGVATLAALLSGAYTPAAGERVGVEPEFLHRRSRLRSPFRPSIRGVPNRPTAEKILSRRIRSAVSRWTVSRGNVRV
jgi:hypothetical protein